MTKQSTLALTQGSGHILIECLKAQLMGWSSTKRELELMQILLLPLLYPALDSVQVLF